MWILQIKDYIPIQHIRSSKDTLLIMNMLSSQEKIQTVTHIKELPITVWWEHVLSPQIHMTPANLLIQSNDLVVTRSSRETNTLTLIPNTRAVLSSLMSVSCRRISGAWRDLHLCTHSRNQSGSRKTTQGKKTPDREGRGHLQLPVRHHLTQDPTLLRVERWG